MKLPNLLSLGILLCLIMPVPIKGQKSSVSIESLKEAAEKGDAQIQFQLGEIFDFGYGVTNDNSEAVKWYRKAAEQGHTNAQFNLGMMYYHGEGVPQNYIQAHMWFNISAATSKGEQYDRAVMVRNFTANKMTKRQIATAQYNLGLRYERGRGVRQDFTEAIKWWRKAAEQDLAMAQHKLGIAYVNGQGVLQDYAEAGKWTRRAAEQGYAGAQNYLGMLYAKGLGVSKNNITAHMWLDIAASQGFAAAIKSRDLLAEEMTSGDIAKAEKRVQICIQSNYKQCD